MKKLLAPLALTALLLAGCGGSGPEVASETVTEEPVATTAQFASIIAENETTWREYGKIMADCQPYSIGMKTPTSLQRLNCGLKASVVSAKAYDANGAIGLLPKAPPEVSVLVGRTTGALSSLASAAAAQKCSDTATEACETAISEVNDAMDELLPILDAWKPYTG